MSARDKVIALAQDGRFPFQIAEALNFKPETVSDILRRARLRGVSVPKFSYKKARRAHGEQTYNRVVDLATSGRFPTEIADILGINIQTVYTKIRQARNNGIDIPKVSSTPGNWMKRRIPVAPEIRDLLEPHASLRGLTPIELGEALIRVIAENDLVNAVLDDGGDHD